VRSKALLVILALIAALAVGLFATGCGGDGDSDSNPPKSEPDADLVRQVTYKSCVREAENSGVAEGMADEYCECAADGVMNELTMDQLEEVGAAGLSGDFDLPPEIQDKVGDIILDCVDQFLEE
jgi:hypothetical protein